MTVFSPFEPCLWYKTATPAPDTGALAETLRTEVCVVGGGYTGLTTAIELRRRGHAVVLLEAQEAGFGGSGRNAGHCTPTFSYLTLDGLRSQLGDERARHLISLQTGAADKAGDYIHRYAIDCEWQQNGYFQGALTPSRIARAKYKAESYAAAGCPSRLVGADEARHLTGSTRFHGGWVLDSGAHLNPLSYSRGLARGALAEGARVFTGSRVEEIAREGSNWRLKAGSGTVIADKIILCTGAYNDGGWEGLDKTYRIQRVFLAATNPLPQELRARILPFNGTMHDGRGDIFVYKYDAAGRLVVSMFPLGRRGRDLPYTYRLLMDRLRWLHPELPEKTRWEHYWTGELDMQRRTIPRLYALGPGALACNGLSGRGVPTGTMLGGVLADWAEGVAEHDLPLPVEPLGKAPAYMSVAPSLMLRWYGLQDRLASRRDGTERPPHS